jgi:membrane-bound lytic murein transglycosylase A
MRQEQQGARPATRRERFWRRDRGTDVAAWAAVTAGLFCVILAVTGCETGGPERSQRPLPPAPVPSAPPVAMPGFHLAPVGFGQLPDWQADQQSEALVAFRRSCGRIDGRRSAGNGQMGGLFGYGGHWQSACRAAVGAGRDDRAARRFFEEWFQPYLVLSAGSDEGLFTGYYEPILAGSRRPTAAHAYPLYRPPAGKGRQPSRAEIEAGALAGRGLELVWVDDPIGAFFLHIQGSGRVRLEDGTVLRIGYAGQNGHTYFPIGRELIRRGEILPEQMSMQAIRAWLEANPDEAAAVMNLNPSYVFFRVLDGDGPVGAQGVPLTPGRSLAVDPSFVPYGVPIWLDTSDPGAGQPLRRLVVAQDTGGAIKGPVRGDVFWGAGPDAEHRAGLMKEPGRYYLLLPRAAALTS